ncbi:MAG: ASPIC/UnbV domain-containing protein [Terriglobales bacterium]
MYSSNDPRLHFGLGAEKTADIDIRWPNGLREKLKAVIGGPGHYD